MLSSERERALAYTRDLVARYRSGLRNPHLPDRIVAFYRNRINELTKEIGLMQADGEEGERIARTKCRVAGL